MPTATPFQTAPAPRRPAGFDLTRLRLPLAALGFFGILAGLASWWVLGGFELLPRVLVAGGILLLGIVIALDPEDTWTSLFGGRAIYGWNTLVVALALLGILGLVNVLANRYQTKWDLTANQRFTLSDQTKQVAQSLPAPVVVKAFLSADDSRRQDVQGLLEDLQQHSGGKLSFQIIDPDTNPGEALTEGVREFGTIVFRMGDKKQNVTGSSEQDLTTALVKLTRPEKKVYFTLGHGERKLDGFEQDAYGQIKQALERDNFKPEPLNLATTRAVPDDAAAVVVAGPTKPFLPEEKEALRAFIDGGGDVMFLLDPGTEADFNDLLARWQVGFTKHLVVDPGKAFLGDARVPVADKFSIHPTTKDMRAATVYPAATSITHPAQGASGSSVFPLATTTERAWAETNLQQIQQDEADPKGPLALVVAIEANVPKAEGSTDPAKRSRLFLVGTSNLVANAFMQLPTGNPDLFLNAANWLAEEEDLIAIRPKPADNRQMLLTGQQSNLLFLMSVLLLPAAVLAAGVAVWWTRR